jgi:gliding-associated putative ABC transporter substrate-binding component GldG
MKSTPVITAIIVLLILFVVNFISSRRFARVDLTEGRVYTLSNSSKRVVGTLDDLVTARAYFSKKLPPYLLGLRQQVSDLLEEYRNYSRGNLKVEFIDPADDPKVETQLQRLGIPKIQMNILQKDKFEVVGGYLGLGFFFEDRTEVIPVVENLQSLEYDVTSMILKVARTDSPKAGFVLKGGEHALDRDLNRLKQELENSYEVVEVDPAADMPMDLSVLVVVDVETLTPEDLFGIDQYIMRGGKTVFLASGVKIGEALQATAVPGDNLSHLAGYGVKVNPQLVMDRSNEMAPFSSGFMQFYVNYPLWVKVRSEGFDHESPIVNKLESLVLPWASPLELTLDTTPDVEARILATSTPYAWTQPEPFQLNPNMLPQPQGATSDEFLAVLLSGSFESQFVDGPPEGVSAEVIPKSPETHMVVVGNSMFVMDNFIQNFRENIIFILNTIDWMSLGDELIEIRSKQVTDRPLEPISDAAKNLFKIGNTVGMSVLLVLFGLYRLIRRQREKRVG